jgi:hypothetical protein
MDPASAGRYISKRERQQFADAAAAAKKAQEAAAAPAPASLVPYSDDDDSTPLDSSIAKRKKPCVYEPAKHVTFRFEGHSKATNCVRWSPDGESSSLISCL